MASVVLRGKKYGQAKKDHVQLGLRLRGRLYPVHVFRKDQFIDNSCEGTIVWEKDDTFTFFNHHANRDLADHVVTGFESRDAAYEFAWEFYFPKT